MTSAQAFLLGAIIGSGVGVFAGVSHILPALRKGAHWVAGRISRS